MGLFIGFLTIILVLSCEGKNTFRVENNQFLVNGKPERILAGNFHYFRTPPEYWEDQLDRMLAMGLNAVEFYIPWNLHETRKGHFDFQSHGKSITDFLNLISKKHMLAMVRPGPYICGEWEFGGFPAWFFDNGAPIELRTHASPYIDYVDDWWNVLLPLLKPHLYVDNGGPIVLVQIENEYGSYGDVSSKPKDANYLQHLIDLARLKLGNEVILYTTDGGSESFMERGTFAGGQLVSFGDGCGNATATWEVQKKFNPPGQSPFMCTEFYTGWLTHWGENYTATSADSVVSSLRQVLEAGVPGSGSVSLYMAFGGSNFGFWSGANGNGGSGTAQNYRPVLQSYDYNAPIAEGGQHGIGLDGSDKFLAVQMLLKEVVNGSFPPEPPQRKKVAYSTVFFKKWASLSENVAKVATTEEQMKDLQPMETIGCYYGFIFYSGKLAADLRGGTVLTINSVQDRALVFINKVYIGQISRADAVDFSNVTIGSSVGNGSTIDILVENEGRVGYSHAMDAEQKGILDPDGILVNNSTALQIQGSWSASCLALENSTAFVPKISWNNEEGGRADNAATTFYQSTFSVEEKNLGDTYLNMTLWTKGLAWVNGHLIGRFWSKGPQKTLFIPKPLLKAGTNDLTVLELLPAAPGSAKKSVSFSTVPIYENVE